MSVTFTVRGVTPDWDAGTGFVDASNANARELLALLGERTDDEPNGARNCRAFVRACDAALVRAAKADGTRLGSVAVGAGGCTVVDGGRVAGYLTRKLTSLRALAATGGDLGTIEWG